MIEPHHQALRITDRGEAIHSSTVDLRLLLIEPVNKIRRPGADRDVLLDAEWRVGKIRRERLARRSRQHAVRLARAIHLRRVLARVTHSVRSGKLAVEVVEAMVLEINDHDVIELLEALRFLCVGRRVSQACQRRGNKKRRYDRCATTEFLFDDHFAKQTRLTYPGQRLPLTDPIPADSVEEMRSLEAEREHDIGAEGWQRLRRRETSREIVTPRARVDERLITEGLDGIEARCRASQG